MQQEQDPWEELNVLRNTTGKGMQQEQGPWEELNADAEAVLGPLINYN